MRNLDSGERRRFVQLPLRGPQVILRTWAQLRRLLFFDTTDDKHDSSGYERFPIPYSFKPRMSVYGALLAALAACLRIILGSFLFALWGTYTLVSWTVIRNVFWRASAELSLFLVFLVLFSLLMIAINILVRFIDRDCKQTSRQAKSSIQ